MEKRLSYIKRLGLSNPNTCTSDELERWIETAKSKSGKPLAETTKRWILSTVKSNNKNIKNINFKSSKKVKHHIVTDLDLTKLISRIDIKNTNPIIHDTYMAILLCMATNFRISELMQLNKQHILAILRGEPIGIRIKKHLSEQIILGNVDLLTALLPHLPEMGPILTTSKSMITNNIKRLVLELYPEYKGLCGINLIRKFTTSLYIKFSGVEAAVMVNRHRNDDTTIEEYCMVNLAAKNK